MKGKKQPATYTSGMKDKEEIAALTSFVRNDRINEYTAMLLFRLAQRGGRYLQSQDFSLPGCARIVAIIAN
jgi:hypothetical protein